MGNKGERCTSARLQHPALIVKGGHGVYERQGGEKDRHISIMTIQVGPNRIDTGRQTESHIRFQEERLNVPQR